MASDIPGAHVSLYVSLYTKNIRHVFVACAIIVRMDIIKVLTQELNIKTWQTEAVIKLIDEGNTIPFIARYRKEATGALNDEVLRTFDERLKYLRALEERRGTILSTIEEQGKLTDELRAQIEAAATSVGLEDLYRPYKPKRRTRAMIAREKGLEPLAMYLLDPSADKEVLAVAASYTDPEKEVETPEKAVLMAQDIIAEMVSDNADFRTWIRRETFEQGLLTSEARDETAESVYENYYHYQEPVRKVPGHRILALNRGEKEKVLTIRIDAPLDRIHAYLENQMGCHKNALTEKYLTAAVLDSYKRLIAPSIETEIRNEMTDNAQEGAIRVFGSNLKQLLLAPPIQGMTVLGWDPAFRTGCKLAVVDPTGKVLDTTVIYPTAPQNKVEEAKTVLARLIRKYKIDLISVGNGTASRESEAIIADFIRETKLPVRYVIVNEAGASVYSASKLATEEFPTFDVGQRSAASIARRLQDPLAELVKIDPKAIGVGQYQHDMNQTRLSEALTGVVEDSVNSVGIDVNTASAALLGYVSGINKTIAKNIVSYREENGAFTSRRQLLKVAKLGPKAFEQCAGFLRIRGGKEALDMTGVHPESYAAAKALLSLLGYSEEDIRNGRTASIRKQMGSIDKKQFLAGEGIGEYTLDDILAELEKPGRDPREDVPGPVLRSDVMDLKDLVPGMKLRGTVRNVVDFGAFVDIGVHQDGLVHVSQLSDRFVDDPLKVVKVGDIVDVTVLSVDAAKARIALTMKTDPGEKAASKNAAPEKGAGDAGKKSREEKGSHKRPARKGGKPSDGARSQEKGRKKEDRKKDSSGGLSYNPFAGIKL